MTNDNTAPQEENVAEAPLDHDDEKLHFEDVLEQATADVAAAKEQPEEDAAELKNQLLRALAEMENTKKRAARDMQDARDYAVTNMARDLIDVMENMVLALASVPEDKLKENEFLALSMKGVQLTYNQLNKVFERYGIKRITPQGEVFDHNFHQAVAHVPSPDAEPGTVIDVMQAGYVMKERLLRPAMVAVAKEA